MDLSLQLNFIFSVLKSIYFFTNDLLLFQGGLTFVLAKGIVKMYYQEQQYIRQSNRRILDYPI